MRNRKIYYLADRVVIVYDHDPDFDGPNDVVMEDVEHSKPAAGTIATSASRASQTSSYKSILKSLQTQHVRPTIGPCGTR